MFQCTIEDLYFFIIIVENKSISKAADILNVSQSRLSKRLKSIENKCGEELIRRTTKSFLITDSGEILYNHAKRIMNMYQDYNNVISQKTEILNIGYTYEWQFQLILEMNSYLKDSNINFEINTIKCSEEMLKTDEIDLFFSSSNTYRSMYHNMYIRENGLSAFVSIYDQLACKNSISVKDLNNRSIIIPHSKSSKNNSITNEIENILINAEIENAQIYHDTSRHNMISEICNSNKVGVLYSSASIMSFSEIVKVFIEEFKNITPIYLLWNNDMKVKKYIEIIRKIL